MSVRPPTSARERLNWLRLIRAENVGPVTFYALLSRFGSAARALDALPEIASRNGVRKTFRIPSLDEAERESGRLKDLGGRFLAIGEEAYPPLLAAIDGAPPLLSVLGDPLPLKKDCIALVGARNASAAGLRMARLLAHDLGENGLVIVSGLARGIDTAAHEASLATGTVAVVAGGADVIYPPENAKLHDAICAQGAVISEMPLGATPQAQHFPRRNRLISGLCRAVVVVEAAERSGSLITARLAGEQGREILAVPGSPLDARCRGANRLIRDGATLVQDAADVREALERLPFDTLPRRNEFGEPVSAATEGLIDTVRPKILQLLGPTPIEIDELIRQSGAPAGVVAAILTELELFGRVTRQGGQWVCLVDPG